MGTKKKTQSEEKTQSTQSGIPPYNPGKGWIAVALEGTLAVDTVIKPDTIGEPNKAVVKQVQELLKQGKDVRVLTWCAGRNPYYGFIQSSQFVVLWCQQHIGQKLPVTCSIDYNTMLIIDHARGNAE